MGDMADMLIEQGFEQWMDGEGYEDEPLAPALKTCRYCGAKGLEWGNLGGKWRLFAGSAVHMCLVNPLLAAPKPRVITDPVEKAFRAGWEAGLDEGDSRANPGIGVRMDQTGEDAYCEYAKTLPRRDEGSSIGEGVADGV